MLAIMSMLSPVPRGPRLRIICVNDIYTLDNFSRLVNLVRHHAKADPADRYLVTLAGDFLGPSMLSSLDKGRGMVDVLNRIGVTHVCFGNHEDDIEIAEMRQRISEFSGVWLNTNMPEFLPPLPPYELLSILAPGGRQVRIGLLGVVMDDKAVYRRKPFGGVAIEPPNPSALGMAAQLVKEHGCACVIPLTHQEYPSDVTLARAQRSPRFPVIIGGHEHKVFLEQVEGTWIVKAGSDAVHAAVIDLSWPAKPPTAGPDLPEVVVRLEAVADYPIDPQLQTCIDGHMAAVQELETAALLRIGPGEVLSSIGTRSRQTSLGTLLCSRIRDMLGSDGCLINGGGIRGGREYHKQFTYGNLKAEMPFGNEVVVIQLPGAIIAEAIAASRAYAPAESGGFLQVDDRMHVETPGHVLTSIGGAPLIANRIYRIALIRDLMTGMDHIEPLVRYAKAHPEWIPPEGSGREIKVVLIDSFSKELWQKLGSFESVDTDQDGLLSESEVAAAVARTTSAPASRITVGLMMAAVDINQDRVISRVELAAFGAIEATATSTDKDGSS